MYVGDDFGNQDISEDKDNGDISDEIVHDDAGASSGDLEYEEQETNGYDDMEDTEFCHNCMRCNLGIPHSEGNQLDLQDVSSSSIKALFSHLCQL